LTPGRQTARSRAESMSPEPGPAASRQASSLQQQGNHQLSGDEVSADELTGFMSRGSSRSYHAVQRTGTSRSRRSIYDHPSQPQVDEDDELPARRSTRRSSRGSTNGPSDSNGRPGKGDDKEELTWWRKPLGTFQSIELENKGSVARDHLALGTRIP